MTFSFGLTLEIFFENDVLETLIRLSIDSSCPDYHQVLETILVVTQSKGDALISLAEREPTLIEQFESKLNQRRIEIQGSDDDQVKRIFNVFILFVICFSLGRTARSRSNSKITSSRWNSRNLDTGRRARETIDGDRLKSVLCLFFFFRINPRKSSLVNEKKEKMFVERSIIDDVHHA